MKIQKNRAIYIGLLIIVWACAYVYILMKNRYKRGQLPVLYICLVSRFWTRLCRYIGSHPSPHQCLSPGISFIDDPAKIFTDSIIAQKILNGLFLLGGALLLFFL